ncbi:MAG: PH domain-containing protein [Nitrososphaeraceae archaeon]
MSGAEPRPGEMLIIQEDCAEEKLKNGILTLTNQRLIFEKTEGRMTTLSKKTQEVLLDIPLEKISASKSEGFIIAKVVVELSDRTYKFGVLNTGHWAKEIMTQVNKSKPT